MRFFRRRSNPVFLALLAFAMQLGLALAQTHFHSDAAGQRSWAKSLAASFCRANALRSCPAPAPAPANDHSTCPICQAVSLASLSVLQAPPALPPTPARMGTPRPARAVASLHGADTVHFQARAPPLA